jgi:hypothetical protein
VLNKVHNKIFLLSNKDGKCADCCARDVCMSKSGKISISETPAKSENDNTRCTLYSLAYLDIWNVDVIQYAQNDSILGPRITPSPLPPIEYQPVTVNKSKKVVTVVLCRLSHFNTLSPHPLMVTLGRTLYITISRLSSLFITCKKPGVKPY